MPRQQTEAAAYLDLYKVVTERKRLEQELENLEQRRDLIRQRLEILDGEAQRLEAVAQQLRAVDSGCPVNSGRTANGAFPTYGASLQRAASAPAATEGSYKTLYLEY